MNEVRIFGSSDDLIEVDGDIREEFAYADNEYVPGHNGLVFSTGTILRVHYGDGDEGIWRITPIAKGTAEIEVDPGTDEDNDYSDIVTITGDIKWVVHVSLLSAMVKPREVFLIAILNKRGDGLGL